MSRPEPPRALTIAIDGPAGAGKSTIARLLARALAVPYLDTGAMYRAVGLLVMREGFRLPLDAAAKSRATEIAASDRISLVMSGEVNRVMIDGVDESEAIRSQGCGMMASAVSAISDVRHELVRRQQNLAAVAGGVVEGRDIASVVLPDADLKVFLTASTDERARRRTDDLQARGEGVTINDVKRQQAQRDRQDTSRASSPLQVVRGAVVVDSTGLAPDEVVERLVRELEERLGVMLDRYGQDTVRSRNHGS